MGGGMEEFKNKCGEGQERWSDDHKNEWKSATDRSGEVGEASPGHDGDLR